MKATKRARRDRNVAGEHEGLDMRVMPVAVEMIVIGGEPPTRMRGGAIFGGIGGERPPEIGPVTEYVLRRAPCRVLLTAPPES